MAVSPKIKMAYIVTLYGGTPWGFRIKGGHEFNEPIRISKVNPNSKAFREGIQEGDIIYKIDGDVIDEITLVEAQKRIKAVGNTLELELKRGEDGLEGSGSEEANKENKAAKDPRNKTDDLDMFKSSTSIKMVNHHPSGEEQNDDRSDSGSMSKMYKPVSFSSKNADTESNFSDSSPSVASSGMTIQLDSLMAKVDDRLQQNGTSEYHFLPTETRDRKENTNPPSAIGSRLYKENNLESSKPGVWSPGQPPPDLTPDIQEREKEKERDREISDKLKGGSRVWAPSGGTVPCKEFRSVKLDSVDSMKPDQPSPQEKVQATSLPEPDSAPVVTEASNVPPPFDRSTSSSSLPASTTADQPSSKPFSAMNGSISSLDRPSSPGRLHLPKTQSPAITLLQKYREGQIPKGAIYVGSEETIEGDVKHTDTYYMVPSGEKQVTSTKTEKKAPKYDGIGPMNEQGLPIAFRSTIDEKNHHEWYKTFYKTLHKPDKPKTGDLFHDADVVVDEQAENTYRPTYTFPEDEPEPKEEEENPYIPSYAKLPQRSKEELPRSNSLDGELERDKDRMRNFTYESFGGRGVHGWSPPHARSKIEVYRNQPRKIEDYEPGYSSIADKEIISENHDDQSTLYNPPIDKPGQNSQYILDPDRKIPTKNSERTSRPTSPTQQHEWYKQVLKGGEIPYEGFRKPYPDRKDLHARSQRGGDLSHLNNSNKKSRHTLNHLTCDKHVAHSHKHICIEPNKKYSPYHHSFGSNSNLTKAVSVPNVGGLTNEQSLWCNRNGPFRGSQSLPRLDVNQCEKCSLRNGFSKSSDLPVALRREDANKFSFLKVDSVLSHLYLDKMNQGSSEIRDVIVSPARSVLVPNSKIGCSQGTPTSSKYNSNSLSSNSGMFGDHSINKMHTSSSRGQGNKEVLEMEAAKPRTQMQHGVSVRRSQIEVAKDKPSKSGQFGYRLGEKPSGSVIDRIKQYQEDSDGALHQGPSHSERRLTDSSMSVEEEFQRPEVQALLKKYNPRSHDFSDFNSNEELLTQSENPKQWREAYRHKVETHYKRLTSADQSAESTSHQSEPPLSSEESQPVSSRRYLPGITNQDWQAVDHERQLSMEKDVSQEPTDIEISSEPIARAKSKPYISSSPENQGQGYRQRESRPSMQDNSHPSSSFSTVITPKQPSKKSPDKSPYQFPSPTVKAGAPAHVQDQHSALSRVQLVPGIVKTDYESEQLLSDQSSDHPMPNFGSLGIDLYKSRIAMSKKGPGTTISECSERSSRIDPQTYQSYTAGILHSTHRSEHFLNMQKHYSTLERISEVEKDLMQKDKAFMPSLRRIKSLKSEKAKEVSRLKLEELQELHELHSELDEAQKKKEFLYDLGNLEKVSWKPDYEWGLLKKPKSLGDLVKVYQQEAPNLNTIVYKKSFTENPDFKRELSFVKLSEKYKNLDDKVKQEKSSKESIDPSGSKFNAISSAKPGVSVPNAARRSNVKAFPQNSLTVEPPSNHYEVYVPSSVKEGKTDDLEKQLHVRSASAPHKEEETKKSSLHYSDSYKTSKFDSNKANKDRAPGLGVKDELYVKNELDLQKGNQQSPREANVASPFRTYESRISPPGAYERPFLSTRTSRTSHDHARPSPIDRSTEKKKSSFNSNEKFDEREAHVQSVNENSLGDHLNQQSPGNSNRRAGYVGQNSAPTSSTLSRSPGQNFSPKMVHGPGVLSADVHNSSLSSSKSADLSTLSSSHSDLGSSPSALCSGVSPSSDRPRDFLSPHVSSPRITPSDVSSRKQFWETLEKDEKVGQSLPGTKKKEQNNNVVAHDHPQHQAHQDVSVAEKKAVLRGSENDGRSLLNLHSAPPSVPLQKSSAHMNSTPSERNLPSRVDREQINNQSCNLYVNNSFQDGTKQFASPARGSLNTVTHESVQQYTDRDRQQEMPGRKSPYDMKQRQEPLPPYEPFGSSQPLMSSTPQSSSPNGSSEYIDQSQDGKQSFSVTNLRSLADNNEFSKGKFSYYAKSPDPENAPSSVSVTDYESSPKRDQGRNPQPNRTGFGQRAASTSALNSHDPTLDPKYGQLKNWHGVVTGLNEEDESQYGRLQKWNQTDLQASNPSMTSSNDTLIIKGSDLDLAKPVESPHGFDGKSADEQNIPVIETTSSLDELVKNNGEDQPQTLPVSHIRAKFESQGRSPTEKGVVGLVSRDFPEIQKRCHGTGFPHAGGRSAMPRTVSGDLKEIRDLYGDNRPFTNSVPLSSAKSEPNLGQMKSEKDSWHNKQNHESLNDDVTKGRNGIGERPYADLSHQNSPYKSATTQVVTQKYHTIGVPKVRRSAKVNDQKLHTAATQKQMPHTALTTNNYGPMEASQKHHHSTSDLPSHKSPVNTLEHGKASTLDRRRRDEEEARRKEYLRQITEEEKKRRADEEYARNEARKHSDFFSPKQKSPVPLDRFDDLENMVPVQVPRFDKKHKPMEVRGKAKALYSFKAQSAKELTFRKGDVIYLLRKIDKNWYEGEHHGLRGIFPINYVEVIKSLEDAHSLALSQEGQAKVKYSFKKQSPVELAVKKGDVVNLLRRVDEHWYEAKHDGCQGIVPISYLDILKEPETPFVTPAPSVVPSMAPSTANTPGPGTPVRPLSPLHSVQITSPAHQHRDNYFNFQDYSPHQERHSRQDSSSGYNREFSPKPDSYRREFSPVKHRDPGEIPSPADYNAKLDYASALIESYQMNQQDSQSKSDRAGFAGRRMGPDGYYRDKQTPPPPPQPKHEQPLKPYRAVFTYVPQNSDELELREGDHVYVLEKCDDGWFVGTSARTGQFGTFPGNYVQLV